MLLLYLASLHNKTRVGGAYRHVDDTMLAQFFDGRGHQCLLHLEVCLVQDASHLTNESLSLIQPQLVILVARGDGREGP